MLLKVVTCPTCHELSGWLKVLAPWNMRYMLVTLETSHASMSSSKLDWPLTRLFMSVTAPTSQAEIGPNRSRADVALLTHAARASWRLSLLGNNSHVRTSRLSLAADSKV